MTLHPADLSLARIVAQRLAGPPLADPATVVAHLGCVQGQDLPGALTSVALRTAERSLAGVRRALDEAKVVRTWPMRGTLHLVPARDAAWMCGLTAPRMDAHAARRRAELGLTEQMSSAAGEIAVAAIRADGPQTRAELLARWEPEGFTEVSGRGYHLLSQLSYRGILTQGPMTADGRTEQRFVVLEDWVPELERPEREQALARWAELYFGSHGPATRADFARWTGLTMTDVRLGIAGATGLTRQEIDGVEHWFAEELPDLLADHRRAAGAPLLLPGFDELILGYADRSCTLDRDHEQLVVPGRNGVFKPTVIHRGKAVGTWKRVRRSAGDRLETRALGELKLPSDRQLDRAFEQLPR
ncbi:hypothetical protein CGZ93_11170 [Enemella dayhoffiae]|uniref:Winged helix DNA-binding domain-containing protein n=1 Tax=Enemella dayhoffiae TaxID=2016507 RepID=A0A255GYY0_9ACTN|nr:winged helix DNA-binding domain-containing protein [Enemella dayhoffiae]OYO20791.1 hypothetical protein CGZ93_11170 [Enemella dayhoffiae]